jgi:hypothetical protein
MKLFKEQRGKYMSIVKIEIKSRPGTFITLDDDVAEKIGGWNWRMDGSDLIFPKIRAHIQGSKPYKKAFCHRAAIWAATGQWPDKGMEIDHINHDRLDNRIENLRLVTRGQNNLNCLRRKRARSEFKGISCRKTDYRGGLTLERDGKRINIQASRTKDENQAAMARDCIVHMISDQTLVFNFPDMTPQDKWTAIGERQRNQIVKSFKKHNITPRSFI